MKVIHIIPHCEGWPLDKALCSKTDCSLSVHRVPTCRGFTFLRLTKEEAAKYRWCKHCLHEAAKSKWHIEKPWKAGPST